MGRLDPEHVLGVERPHHRGQERARCRRDQLDPEHRDAHRARGLLLLADRHQVVAEARPLDEPGDEQREEEEPEPGQRVGALAVEGEVGHARGEGEGETLGASGEVAEVDGQDLEHLGQRDGREGEERPSQPDGEVADHEREERGQHTPRQHADPRGEAGREEQQARGVRPDAEEGRVAEGELARVPAEQVPGDGRRRPHVDLHDDVEVVRVRRGERQRAEHDERRAERERRLGGHTIRPKPMVSAPRWPKSPCGRTSSTRTKIRKSKACFSSVERK